MAKNPLRPGKKAKLLNDQAVALADYAAKALVAANDLGIKNKAIEQSPLGAAERATLAQLPSLPAKLKKGLAKKLSFTVAEAARMVLALAESLLDVEPTQQVAFLRIAKGLMDGLQRTIVLPHSTKEPRGAGLDGPTPGNPDGLLDADQG